MTLRDGQNHIPGIGTVYPKSMCLSPKHMLHKYRNSAGSAPDRNCKEPAQTSEDPRRTSRSGHSLCRGNLLAQVSGGSGQWNLQNRPPSRPGGAISMGEDCSGLTGQGAQLPSASQPEVILPGLPGSFPPPLICSQAAFL